MKLGAKLSGTLPDSKLYIITTLEFYPTKIGVSIAPERRLRHLQTANWKQLQLYKEFECPGRKAFFIESTIHRKLEKKILLGEWIDISAIEAEIMVLELLGEKNNFELDLHCL